MGLIVIGTNHKHSPVDLREKLFFTRGKLRDAFVLLKTKAVLKGTVILSTCNRTEIYADAEDVPDAVSEVVNFLSEYRGLGKEDLRHHLYIYKGKDAARHLCEVSSGLDSLIMGELQIMGQVRTSLRESENAGFAGLFLKDIFRSALSIAGKVHANTGISEGKVSVGSVAVDFIKEKAGILSGKNIMVVGVGKVTELVLKYLKEPEASVVFVSNRTYEKAKGLAGQIGARAVRFSDLRGSLKEADIVISATASPHFIITGETVGEREKPLLIIDLAVPRDVDPAVNEAGKIDLFSLEDLDAVIRKNISRKLTEAVKAGNIINTEVEKLWERSTKSEREPVLSL